MLVYSKRSSKEGFRAGGSRAEGRAEGKNMDGALTPPNSDAPNTRLLAKAAPEES
jgi:hypothetical protein